MLSVWQQRCLLSNPEWDEHSISFYLLSPRSLPRIRVEILNLEWRCSELIPEYISICFQILSTGKSNTIELFSKHTLKDFLPLWWIHILLAIIVNPAGLVHSFLSFKSVPSSFCSRIASSSCLESGSSLKVPVTLQRKSTISPLWTSTQCSQRFESFFFVKALWCSLTLTRPERPFRSG